MKRWVVISTIMLSLGTAACSGNAGFKSKAKVEKLDGVKCLVVRNSVNNAVRALDCDWSNQ